MCNNCINEQLQAERDELHIQVSALTQALETQKRENQPYIKEMEARNEQFKQLLLYSKELFFRIMAFPEPDKTVHSDIYHFIWNELEELFPSPAKPLSDLSENDLNATGGDKPEQEHEQKEG